MWSNESVCQEERECGPRFETAHRLHHLIIYLLSCWAYWVQFHISHAGMDQNVHPWVAYLKYEQVVIIHEIQTLA